LLSVLLFFFFSSRRRHTRFKCDWSSDVCSSDLEALLERLALQLEALGSLLELRVGILVLEADLEPLLARQLIEIGGVDLRARLRSEERRVGKEWRCRWWR